MAKPEVVLDTNVLVTALRSRRGASFHLIRLIAERAFLPNISVALALEYEEVLKRPDMVPGLTADDIDGFLDFILQSSNLVPSVLLNRPSLTDPDDELVLDLALHRSAAIITYNKRDFAEAVKRGVAVLTPREFPESLRQAK